MTVRSTDEVFLSAGSLHAPQTHFDDVSLSELFIERIDLYTSSISLLSPAPPPFRASDLEPSRTWSENGSFGQTRHRSTDRLSVGLRPITKSKTLITFLYLLQYHYHCSRKLVAHQHLPKQCKAPGGPEKIRDVAQRTSQYPHWALFWFRAVERFDLRFYRS